MHECNEHVRNVFPFYYQLKRTVIHQYTWTVELGPAGSARAFPARRELGSARYTLELGPSLESWPAGSSGWLGLGPSSSSGSFFFNEFYCWAELSVVGLAYRAC